MKLTNEDIREFQALYHQRFGKELPRDEAIEQANKLIRYTQVIYGLHELQQGEN